jgi:hypothetical protein
MCLERGPYCQTLRITAIKIEDDHNPYHSHLLAESKVVFIPFEKLGENNLMYSLKAQKNIVSLINHTSGVQN